MASQASDETYLHGYGEAFQRYHNSRTLAADAPFIIPFLRSGLTLLDCGCGPGSITCDLAEVVAPGQVTGIDISEVQLDRATKLAGRRGIANIRFERGDIHELPFGDQSFDVAFAHNVLEHLRDPLRALREMRRVLKPGGVVGIHDPDFGTWLYEPETIRPAVELLLRVADQTERSFFYARHQRRLLREDGFVRTQGFAVAESFGSREGTRMIAAVGVQQMSEPGFVETVIANGWADEHELAGMLGELKAWGEHPDAYWAIMAPAAVAWVPTRED